MSAEELAKALDHAARNDYTGQYDLPYIDTDIDCVDGSLLGLLRWLIDHYEIRPRTPGGTDDHTG
jgi:hypothetical protein